MFVALHWPWLRHLHVVGLLCLIALPLLARALLGWSSTLGYLSDLALSSLLVLLCWRAPLWRSVPLLLLWALSMLGSAELVSAMGRMPETADLQFLADPQFIGNTAQSSGMAHPWLALGLLGSVLLVLLSRLFSNAQQPALRVYWYVLPPAFVLLHLMHQHLMPSEADQWQQYNLPHKWLAEASSLALIQADNWRHRHQPEAPLEIAALNRLDMSGTPLLDAPGQARNLLIITLEGLPGAYLGPARKAIGSRYQQELMPRLSAWAERGMLTPDYVLHSHQTIRGLYAMLCGDYSKLDSGTPKGIELLNHKQRNLDCLPAQMHRAGFSTHFLQGAGLRFMAKDKIMPHMGFQKTLGRDSFSNPPYLDFAWGMDDKAFMEGALAYVKKLQRTHNPWMLTLLTVGTHQPYAAPAAYIEQAGSAKAAAVAYLDDAIGDFLDALDAQGVLQNTLVVITSDESHGLENVRLASAWGFNLMLAPEQAVLPAIKAGVYGHVDLSVSLLDYFGLPMPQSLAGRSIFRDYAQGREIMSYTNGLLRLHDGQGVLTECNFKHHCRRYASTGFIADQAHYLGQFEGRKGRLLSQRAALLDHSLQSTQTGHTYQFASHERIHLKQATGNDWTDNLIGAQYLELPKDSRTRVTLNIRGHDLSHEGARLLLKAKEFEQNVALPIPLLPQLKDGKTLELNFAFDNPKARKAFSFHLLGEGRGSIEIVDFSVISETLTSNMAAAQAPLDAVLAQPATRK